MKATVLKLALAATVASGATAQPHGHGHHLHHKRSAGESEKRDVVVEWAAATETVYQIGASVLPAKDAAEGLKKGLYVVLGESTPDWTPPAPSTSVAAPEKSAALFIEKVSTSATLTPTSTPTPTPTPTPTLKSTPKSTTSAAASSSSSASSDDSNVGSGGTGLDAEFPSGKISCSQFPSDYGAVPITWLGTGGWDTVVKVPKFKLGDLSIDFIETGVKGWKCEANDFCSYACPSGYAKSQWPENVQGATGQSIGGLYCNANGKLELTRPTYKTLCQKGAGGVFIRNELDSNAAVCMTSYPASEAMVIPTDTLPGKTSELTNIDSANYYKWQGKPTTAQFYLNYAGIPVDDACVWNSVTNPKGAGNWAPMNIGVGKDIFGITYISIFPNKPTTDAILDYTVEFEGNYNGECSFQNGQYTGGANGCTIAVTSGNSVTIVLKK